MEILAKALGQVSLGDHVCFKNLAMFPLLNGPQREPDYLTLDEAMSKSYLHITEVSTGGSVPELKCTNEGDLRVLLLDGEELVGAKQNRVLNLTILVPPMSTIVIPVSCVEAGRWSDVWHELTAASTLHYSAGRARRMKSVSGHMAQSGSRQSDQAAVWEDIAAKADRLHARSSTHAMSAIFGQHQGPIEDYVRAFDSPSGQVGAVFAINGDIIGCDLFDSAATLRKLMAKLVSSYALDAIDLVKETAPEPGADEIKEFLSLVGRAETRAFPSVGIGDDVRLSGPGITGAALVAGGRVIHLGAFVLEEQAQREPEYPEAQSNLARPSRRRGFRTT
ncbi:MAG: hypothetical protein HYV04_00210 [Deltaproteobacteria bacterium]|nr:hypothetical protein [Deltaproteobacteria bacterium]